MVREECVDRASGRGLAMSLRTPSSVEKLQMALQAKAKAEPEFRFYQLYDKLYREDVLTHAYTLCRSNRGAPGVDDVDFERIESYGLANWLGELTQELKQKCYQSDPVKRVWIPKPDGSLRPLGIPCIRDRVVQTAAVLVLGAVVSNLPMAERSFWMRSVNSPLTVR